MYTVNDDQLLKEVSRYPFYHRIKLTEAVTTPGNPGYVPTQNMTLRALESLDLSGKRVLDVGCRDGLFSLAAERMGAAEVVGIDNDLSPGAVELVLPFLKSRVRLHQLNVYDLKPDSFGLFDVVIFPGVLYHLRYPFWGLRAIREVLRPGAHLLTETAIWEAEEDRAILFCPVGKESPYGDPTSVTFFNEKGLCDTLSSMGLRTIRTERLLSPAEWRPSRVKAAVKALLRRPPTRVEPRINRGLFHSIYEGGVSADLHRYWEGFHDAHTASPTAERLVV